MAATATPMIERRVAELMFAHLCHELIGPVTAINNGFELIDPGQPVPEDVRELLVRSAKNGAQRLRFYRIAYGPLGEDAAFGLDEARALLEEFLDGGKVALRWGAGAAKLGPAGARLLLNAVALGVESLPRGGTVTTNIRNGRATALALVCAGEGARVNVECARALSAEADVGDLTPRSVHAYFASRFAAAHGGELRIRAPAPARVEVTATIPNGV